MKLFLLILITAIQNCYLDTFLSKFHQHDYKIKNFRMELVQSDDNVFSMAKVKQFKYNRTTTSYNITIKLKQTVGRNLENVVQGYKFLSNEYRRIELRFQVNFCKAFDSNVIGLQSAARHCGNITECYFYKDTVYHFCNYLIDESQLPPLIPDGLYKFSNEFLYLHQVIGELNLYFEIYRPIYPKK